MTTENKFLALLQEHLNTVSTTEKEAIALAMGFYPHLEEKFRLKHLKNFIKTEDINLKRAALTGLAFSALHRQSSKAKKQQGLIKNSLDDPLSSVRLTASIALGFNALFSNKKFQKSNYNEFQKKIRRADPQIKQGFAIGLGLLANFPDTRKDSFLSIIKAFNYRELENPGVFLVGLTLAALNSGKAEEGLDFIINSIIPYLANKESRRIAVICSAFLFPLIADPLDRIKRLDNMIKQGIEFHSKFGTDSALILTYFSLSDKKHRENLLIRLLGLQDLDPDYAQIYSILKDNRKAIDILQALLISNTVDIKAAGINASFFLESYESEISQLNLKPFINEGLQQRGAGYFDRFLVMLRALSYCLLRKDYDRAVDFELFLHSNDRQIRRFAGLSYACLKAKNPDEKEIEEIYARLITEADEYVRWGYWIGLAIHEIIGNDPLDDELILGLLLLSIGSIDASTTLLISQAMISKYYEAEKA